MVYILPKLLCRVMHVHSVYVWEKLNLVKIFENILTVKNTTLHCEIFPLNFHCPLGIQLLSQI